MKLDEQTERDPNTVSKRPIAMGLIAIAAFTAIVVRLYLVQIRQGAEFSEKSRGNFVQFNRIEHDRGEIVDREGRVLVTNRPSVTVDLTPAFFPPTGRLVTRLARVADVAEKQIDAIVQAIDKAAEEEEGPAILLASDLSEEEVRAIRSMQQSLEAPLRAVPIIEMPHSSPPGRYAAYLDPEHFPTPSRVLRRLSESMGLSQAELDALRKKIGRTRGLDRYLPIVVRRDVPPDAEARVSQHILLGDLPGVSVRRAKSRHYEFEDLGAHLLGYVNELSPQELEERRELGYRLGDSIGRRGVEKTFEENLRGSDGREAAIVDSKGRAQSSNLARFLQDEIGVREAPRAGDRVYLTIDLDLQKAAERAFPGRAGAVVVMDVHTGRILALTSTPSFNPNMVTGYFDPREKRRLDENQQLRPWRFRAIQDHFAPGSTFKVMTAIAAMMGRVTSEAESVFCPGAFHLGSTRFRCWKDAGHGPVNVVTAIEKSCDVYFYTMGARLGLDPIAHVAFDLGLGSRTGIPIDGESPGIIPTQAWYKENLPEGYTLGAAVNGSVGQGATTVTPIQLAVAYAAIANGGRVMEPQIGLRIEPNDGGRVVEIPPKLRRELKIPQRVIAFVQEGLRRVVNEPSGTAYRRRIPDIEVSGKTGTAQVAKLTKRGAKLEDIPWVLRDHAWFAAYAPASDPEIVVVVLNEHGGGGSAAAAPTAMQVIAAWHAKKTGRSVRAPPGASLPTFAVLVDEDASWPDD